MFIFGGCLERLSQILIFHSYICLIVSWTEFCSSSTNQSSDLLHTYTTVVNTQMILCVGLMLYLLMLYFCKQTLPFKLEETVQWKKHYIFCMYKHSDSTWLSEIDRRKVKWYKSASMAPLKLIWWWLDVCWVSGYRLS